ncbi:hypothetical protein A3L09_00435 [Thermococcus profundus]|uniref:Uncharacterized protein n=2 Tax=Thermococcus profundus TaxID=49899 RepID=A0A2Z2M8Z8_THEPR|nr:hypothetical protein A3L09_00435 [Thermococcus profundus]
MWSSRVFSLFFIGLLVVSLSLVTQSAHYGVAVNKSEADHPKAMYSIGTSLVEWNGSGYLLGSIGYHALITNVSVIGRTQERCVIKIEYLITRAYGRNVTVNMTLEKTFTVDRNTNSFVLNNNTAFFPFYVCDDQFKYTYHFNEKAVVKKDADEVLWKNVPYNGSLADMAFGPSYSVKGRDTVIYSCSEVNATVMKCIRFDSQVVPIIDADFYHHYVIGVHAIYPGDPLGILNGSVEVFGGIVKSEKTARLLGARVGSRFDEDNPTGYLAGALILVIAGIILWRVRR